MPRPKKRPPSAPVQINPPAVTIIDVMDDPNLCGRSFEQGDWSAWRVWLKALFALPMDEDERAVYRECTGLEAAPETPATEAYGIMGRRGGKSRIASLIVLYVAVFRDYVPLLAPGQRAFVMLLAADKVQAQECLRYISGMFASSALLAPLVERETQWAIHLTVPVTIQIATSNFRLVRGRTIVATVCDEIAFWPADESLNPDEEVLTALRPAMATVPNPLLLCISSPYARKGVLWKAFKEWWGKSAEFALVWQAPTRRMNPTVPQAFLDREYAKDYEKAQAEYGAEFRSDVGGFVDAEIVASLVDEEIAERPPCDDVEYVGFVDPSGGRSDSMVAGIAHLEMIEDRAVAILDVVREHRPPFSPESVVAEHAPLFRSYRITRIEGDAYAGEWPVEQYRKHEIEYAKSPLSKSDLYLALLPLINARAVALVENKRLVAQLTALERRTRRGGKDSVDHPPKGHDDVINAAAGALVRAYAAAGIGEPALWGGVVTEETEEERQRAASASIGAAIKRSGFYWPG